MISQTNQRVAVLIDTANLYHTAKYVYRSKVHFESLVRTVASGRSITRAIAYAITSDNETETAFLETLSSAGIEVRTKPLITYRSGTQKADWDVGITVDAIALAHHVDTIIIVSGDGDFAPLMRQLRSMGVRAEAAAFDQSVSQMLIDVVDQFHDLSTMTDSILINARNPIAKRQETDSPMNASVPLPNVGNTKTINSEKDVQPVALRDNSRSRFKKVNQQNTPTKTISEQDKLAEMHSRMTKIGVTPITTKGTHETKRPKKK